MTGAWAPADRAFARSGRTNRVKTKPTMTIPQVEDRLLTVEEVAQLLHISRSSVYRLFSSAALASVAVIVTVDSLSRMVTVAALGLTTR